MIKGAIRALAVLSALIPVAASGMPLDYEPRESRRPLTIPDGIFEVGAGGISPVSLPPTVSNMGFLQFRYGVTDNLELVPIGFKYRFLHYAIDDTEASIGFCIPQFGTSTGSNGTSHNVATSAKGEIKSGVFHDGLSMRGMIHGFNNQRYGDTASLNPLNIAYAYEAGGGIVYSFTRWGSITFNAYYQKINGAQIANPNQTIPYQTNMAAETVDVVLGVIGLEYNTAGFDIKAEYFQSSGSRSFHSRYGYQDYGKMGLALVTIIRF